MVIFNILFIVLIFLVKNYELKKGYLGIEDFKFEGIYIVDGWLRYIVYLYCVFVFYICFI